MPLAIGQVPFCHHFDDDGDNHVMGVLVLIVGDSEDTKLTKYKKVLLYCLITRQIIRTQIFDTNSFVNNCSTSGIENVNIG